MNYAAAHSKYLSKANPADWQIVLDPYQDIGSATYLVVSKKALACACGKGHASHYDNLCKFCRELLVSRAVAKSVNVRHSGDGMSITQYRVAIGELNRKDVYI